MAPTNVKTVHQTSLLHTESNLDRLGLLSPAHGQRSQQQSGQITLQSVLINKSKLFVEATHFTEIKKIEIPRSMVSGGSLAINSSNGKYIGYGLRIEAGTERTTIVDIFSILQKVRDTGIHLKVDAEQWRITRGSKRQAVGSELRKT